MKKDNVILVIADQWRSDSLGLNGNPATYTPNLDELAADGVNFSNAYCQNPVCVPSRCSFLSGLYPHTLGHRTMHYLQWEEVPNIMKTFKENDYQVYWGGRNDFLHLDADISKYCDVRFDPIAEMMKMMKQAPKDASRPNMMSKGRELETEWRSKPGHNYSHFRGIDERNTFLGQYDLGVFKNAINFIENRETDRPFFMHVAGMLPHPPYGVVEKYLEHIDITKIDEPIRLTAEELEKKASILRGIRNNQEVYKLSDKELIELKYVYYAMGTELDEYIGMLVETLKEQSIYDETTIVFFADHGDYTGDYEIAEKNQNTFEDMLTNVPLIIKPSKSHEVKSRTTDALVELIDIQSTVFDYAGITPKEINFGKSLKEVIAGSEQHRKYVHCEGGRTELDGSYAHDAGHGPENDYWPRTSEQTKIPQHTKALMVRSDAYKYIFRLYESDEFYDLTADPHERNNIIESINDEAVKGILNEMKYEALGHMVFSSDFVPNRYDKRT